VKEVTDDKALPKDERKRQQIENAPKKSRAAKLIKLADKTSNLRAIALSPAADWSVERRYEYIEWASIVVASLRGVSPWLEGQFDDAAGAARRSLCEGVPIKTV
jgi:GTP diphosphokinase / guanosine-3',5'-bis(diphosphate) 3'-diphosphatase